MVSGQSWDLFEYNKFPKPIVFPELCRVCALFPQLCQGSLVLCRVGAGLSAPGGRCSGAIPAQPTGGAMPGLSTAWFLSTWEFGLDRTRPFSQDCHQPRILV